MNTRALLLTSGLAIAMLSVVACSDDEGGPVAGGGSGGGGAPTGPAPCNEDPWQCPDGQTCWVNPSIDAQCLNSGAGQDGADCQAQLGMPTCADDLLCFQQDLDKPGTCVAFCDPADPAHSCASGATCGQVTLQASEPAKSVAFMVCVPEGGMGGAGGGGTGGLGEGGMGGTGEGGMGGAGADGGGGAGGVGGTGGVGGM